MDRRIFLNKIGATTVGLALFQSAFGNNFPLSDINIGVDNLNGVTGAGGRVVVIGGGMAGTTVAKYLRLWGGTNIDVTLVEPNAVYYSNIFSNMILTGERTLSQLSFDYNQIKTKYGVKVVTDSVVAIDPTSKTVTLKSGMKLSYDRLVLAPGIDFEPLPIAGTASAMSKVVHAWKAGVQTTSLQAQIKAMTKKDTCILTIPPKPYRCPPGPYERACVIADYLKRVKGGGKVIVLDANNGIQAEVENFTKAFNLTHKSVITYVPNAIISNIDANTGTVQTSVGKFSGKVINAIPTHKAGNLIGDTGIGLANAGGGKWAGVNVLSYESTSVPNIHIIGDSAATTQPKAGHIANAEAKVCADAIIQILKGESINPAPMTNSACYTPITKSTASWLTVVYRYDPVTRTMMPTGNGVTESAVANTENYKEMLIWFDNLMADSFK